LMCWTVLRWCQRWNALKRRCSAKTYLCLHKDNCTHTWSSGGRLVAFTKLAASMRIEQRIIASATGGNTGWPHCVFWAATTAMNTYTILRFPRIWTPRKCPVSVFALYHHHTPWRTLPLPKCIVISDVCADLSSRRCRIFRVIVDRFRTWSCVRHVQKEENGILSKTIVS